MKSQISAHSSASDQSMHCFTFRNLWMTTFLMMKSKVCFLGKESKRKLNSRRPSASQNNSCFAWQSWKFRKNRCHRKTTLPRKTRLVKEALGT